MENSHPIVILLYHGSYLEQVLIPKILYGREMYADFFTETLQGTTLWRFRDMIQRNLESNPDVYMIYPRAMSKVTS